jgi:signal transduction protein with GAF and PtsI domain
MGPGAVGAAYRSDVPSPPQPKLQAIAMAKITEGEYRSFIQEPFIHSRDLVGVAAVQRGWRAYVAQV